MKPIWIWIAAACLFSAAAMPEVLQAAEGKPNVLIIFTDQWRAQALGCNGDQNARTPHLDRLAAGGANFQRCYATNPVCSPAKAAFQTGRYPHQTGVINNSIYLPETRDSLAHCFSRAGYSTGYIGKWHLDGAPKPGFVKPGRRQGYQFFEGFNRGHWYYQSKKLAGARYFTDDGKLIKPKEFESIYQTDLAIGYMKRNREKPFLLFLSYGTPHSPYVPPAPFDHYKSSDLKWRPNVSEKIRQRYAKGLCGYYGLIEMLDHEVGRLVKFMKGAGLLENTIIFFTSDHGDSHGSHGLQHKGHPEEESAGIPLLLHGPGVRKGLVSQVLASQIDFAPTLLSMAGIPVPESMVGRDLSIAVGGGKQEVPWVYLEGKMQQVGGRPAADTRNAGGRVVSSAWRTLVTPRYKLAVDSRLKVRLLVDLEKDPYELKNLATGPSLKKVRGELLEKLKEVGKSTGDPFPKPLARAKPR
ncbi:MAG: sulfatase-like hydrolase/transferase [Planctomycetota bacterium]